MQLCFLLEEKDYSKNFILTHKLEDLKKEGIISDYATISAEHLGFPLSEPGETVVYRADYAIPDLDIVIQKYEDRKFRLGKKTRIRKLWRDARPTFKDIEKFKRLRREIYNPTVAFFETSNIKEWTKQFKALNNVDTNFHVGDNNEVKNEFAYRAFLLMDHGNPGYLMTRAAIAKGKRKKLEKSLDGKYVMKIITIRKRTAKKN